MTEGRQRNAFIDDLDDEGAQSYLRLRPSYPPEVVTVLLDALASAGNDTARMIASTSSTGVRQVADAQDSAAADAQPPQLPEDVRHVAGSPASEVPDIPLLAKSSGATDFTPALRASGAALSAVDIGAGSGQLTRLLAEAGFRTTAVEPSSPMRNALLAQPWVAATHTRIVEGMAEGTGLPSSSTNLVTWAQCFHWLDGPRATAEAARLLEPHGVAAVIYNQFDTRQPWVHRLTRIMRSGDVVERQPQPQLGPHFGTPTLVTIPWLHRQTPEQVMELARTRSSYIRSDTRNRRKMQDNLRWYLFDHLGFYEGEAIELPYRTFVWWAPVHD